jgi:hypothetical protein
MNPRPTLVAAILGAACTLSVLAQPAGKPAEKGPASAGDRKKQYAAAVEKSSAPTEQHKALAPLVGSFDIATEARMGPGEPMRMHGVGTGAWTMGGRFVRMDSAAAPDEEVKGERMNVFGYDPAAKKYTLWGIESGSLTAYSATGDYDAASKTLTFDGERDGPGGGKMPFRWTLKALDGGGLAQSILMKPPGAPDLVEVVSVKYTPR